MNKSSYSKTLLPVIAFMSISFILHYILVKHSLPEIYSKSSFELIYLFLVPLTLIGIAILIFRYTKNANSLGKNFFAYTIIKMMATLGFLTPWLINKTEVTRPFVYQFMLVFFAFLLIETLQLVRLLNGKS